MDAASPLIHIDLQRLALNLGGNRHAIKDMVEVFLKTCGETLRKLDQASKAHDAAQWGLLIQHLKNGAHRVTAKRIAALCVDAERITRLPHEQTASILYHFNKEYAKLQEVVPKQLGALGKGSLL